MIGYNERQEALNLLALLRQSRQKLTEFNRLCALVQQSGSVTETTLAGFVALAVWEESARTGAAVALCFAQADKVQRMPYDLLARCPLLEEETEEAPLDDALLEGLAPEEKRTQRRLYHRLLCIQPMRTLLSRLHALSCIRAEMRGDALRAALIKEILKRAFHEEIPLLQERRSGTELDLRGNDFTILDRLMDNRGKSLREDAEFVVSVPLMCSARYPETLLTAAIANRFEQSCRAGKLQYMAIPGGHTALSVYGGGAPDQFFRAVSREEKQRHAGILHLRSYGGMQLVQLDAYARAQLDQGLFRPEALELPLMAREDAFCALDDGGRSVYMHLSQEMLERRQLLEGNCLEHFLKGLPLTQSQEVQAIRLLREEAQAFFARPKMPPDCSGGVRRVTKSSKHLGVRAVRLLVAHAARDGRLVEACAEGAVPPSLLSLLADMEVSDERRAAFQEDVRRMDERSTLLDMRYQAGPPRVLQAVRASGGDWLRLNAWLARAAYALEQGSLQTLDEPCFTAGELAEYCRYGLCRLVHSGQQVGTKDRRAFSIAKASSGSRTEPDICFQLFCLWCSLAVNGGQPVPICENAEDVEKTLFVLRKGPVSFVELIAGANRGEGAAAADRVLTPEALKAFLPQIRGQRLEIRRKKGVLCISCRPESP